MTHTTDKRADADYVAKWDLTKDTVYIMHGTLGYQQLVLKYKLIDLWNAIKNSFFINKMK